MVNKRPSQVPAAIRTVLRYPSKSVRTHLVCRTFFVPRARPWSPRESTGETAVYKSGTGTRGRGHRDACVGTWDVGTRDEGLVGWGRRDAGCE